MIASSRPRVVSLHAPVLIGRQIRRQLTSKLFVIHHCLQHEGLPWLPLNPQPSLPAPRPRHPRTQRKQSFPVLPSFHCSFRRTCTDRVRETKPRRRHTLHVGTSVDDRSYETGWIPGPGGTAPILRVTLNLPLRHFDLFLLPPFNQQHPPR